MRNTLLIPSRTEWSTYSAHQKRGVAIYLVTLGTVLCSIGFWVCLQISDKLSQSESEKLIGIWYSEYSWDSPSGKITVIGTTQNLASGNYNFAGELSMSMDKQKKTDITWYVSATGKWSLNKKLMTIQLMDMKSSIKRVSLNELDLSKERIIFPFLSDLKLESFFPSNLTETSTVLAVSEKEIVTEKTDLAGKPLIVKSKRVNAPFSSTIQ